MATIIRRSWTGRGPSGHRVKRSAYGYSIVVGGKQVRRYDDAWTKEDAQRALAEFQLGINKAQEAIDMVKQTNEAVELAPANSYTRRLQHQLIERYQLVSESVGVEPQRRVRILPISA